MRKTPARPGLKFDAFDDLLADVDRLRGGYEKAGRWDLGRVVDHLAKTMGSPFAAGARDLPWPLSAIARAFVRRMVRRRRYPTAVRFPAPASIRPPVGADVDAASAALRSAIERVRSLPDGPFDCPPFGRLEKADFVGLQLLHAAHHLSYLRRTTG